MNLLLIVRFLVLMLVNLICYHLLKLDSLEDEFDTAAAAMQFQSEPSRAPFLPFVPKVEEPTEEELEKMLQERYKPGSTFVTYAEDNYESKRTVEMPEHCPSVKDPIIWKVKCMV